MRPFLLILFFSFISLDKPHAQEWKTLLSEEYKFSIEMPGEPILLNKRSLNLAVVESANYVLEDTSAKVAFTLSYMMYDSFTIASYQRNKAAFLDGFWSSFGGSKPHATLVTKKNITHQQGHSGLELIYVMKKNENAFQHSKMYFVDGRFYNLTVLYDYSKRSTATKDKFFQSFSAL